MACCSARMICFSAAMMSRRCSGFRSVSRPPCRLRLVTIHHALKLFVRHAHHDLAKQRSEAAISIERKTQIAGLRRQTLHGLFVQTEIQHRVHHARHRERGAGTHRNQQRVFRIAESLADLLFDLLQAFLDLFPHAFGENFCRFRRRRCRLRW